MSTGDQNTIPAQVRELTALAEHRGWTVVRVEREVASGAAKRAKRDALLEAAGRGELDVILVWKLDRWGRSVSDLLATLHDLTKFGVVFVSKTEALDLSTSSGRALAGMLAVFAEFERDMIRERVRAGLRQAREAGTQLGRPAKTRRHRAEVRALRREGFALRAIADQVGVSEASVRRLLRPAGQAQ